MASLDELVRYAIVKRDAKAQNSFGGILQNSMEAYQAALDRKQKRLENQAAMYQVLRDSGMSPSRSTNAVLTGQFPQDGGGPTIKEQSLNAKTSGSSVNVYTVNPANNTMTQAGTVPKNSKVYSAGGAGTTPQTDIVSTADGIISGIIPPDVHAGSRDWTRLSGELSRRGVDLKKSQGDWLATKTALKNINSTQQIRLRQAMESVSQSIPKLRILSEDFKRTGWTPANYVELKLALTGTDPTKRDQATRFIGQLNLMKDELAQTFVSGNAPISEAFKLADDILSPIYGSKQLSVALDQLEVNLQIRKNAIESITPITLESSAEQAAAGVTQSHNLNTVVTPSQKQLYNQARAQGLSKEEARAQAGF